MQKKNLARTEKQRARIQALYDRLQEKLKTQSSPKPATPQPSAPKSPRTTAGAKTAEHAAQIQHALEDWRSGKAYYSNGNYRLHTEPSQFPTSKWGGRSIAAPWNAAAKREFPGVDDLAKAARLPSYVPKATTAKAARDIKAAADEHERQRRAVDVATAVSPTMKALSEGKVVLTHAITDQGSVRMIIAPIMHPDGTFEVQTFTSRSEKDAEGNYTPHVTWPDYRLAALVTSHFAGERPYPLAGTYKNVKSGMRALLAATKPTTSGKRTSGAKATSGAGKGKAQREQEIAAGLAAARRYREASAQREQILKDLEVARRDHPYDANFSDRFKAERHFAEVVAERRQAQATMNKVARSLTDAERETLSQSLNAHDLAYSRDAQDRSALLWAAIGENTKRNIRESKKGASQRATTPDLARLTLRLADVQTQVARLRREGAAG